MSTEISCNVEETSDLCRERYRRAAERLRVWAQQDSEYDECVGQVLEAESADLGMNCRNENESDT